MSVLRDAVAANVVAVLTQFVEVVRRSLGRFCVQTSELPHHLRRARRDAAHQARIKQIAFRNGVVDLSVFGCVIAQNVQEFRKIIVFLLLFVAFQFQFRKQAVSRKGLIQRVQEVAILRVIDLPCFVAPNVLFSIFIAMRMLLVPVPGGTDDRLNIVILRLPAKHRLCLF